MFCELETWRENTEAQLEPRWKTIKNYRFFVSSGLILNIQSQFFKLRMRYLGETNASTRRPL